MKYRFITAALIVTLACMIAPSTHAKTPSAGPEVSANRGVVELETTRTAGISVRVAEDLANVIDDGGRPGGFCRLSAKGPWKTSPASAEPS